MAKLAFSNPLFQALAECGIGDINNIRRVVIDIQSGHAPVVHVEHYGDERLIGVVRALEGVEVTVNDLARKEVN